MLFGSVIGRAKPPSGEAAAHTLFFEGQATGPSITKPSPRLVTAEVRSRSTPNPAAPGADCHRAPPGSSQPPGVGGRGAPVLLPFPCAAVETLRERMQV